MSLESVRAFFAQKAPDIAVIEITPASSATVALAAEAYGVEPGRIAKTLSLRTGDRAGSYAGDQRHLAHGQQEDSRRGSTGGKPKMLGAIEVHVEITGHEVGGVCPFGFEIAAAGLLRRVAADLR